jgi:aryl-alcohol dehydrogenase-like predicted oxidoreductase
LGRSPILTQNQRLVEELKNIAADKGATPSQIAIAWVLAKGQILFRLLVPVNKLNSQNP